MQSCLSAGVIPDETKALSLLAPANAVAGLLPGGGLLPTPNPLSQVRSTWCIKYSKIILFIFLCLWEVCLFEVIVALVAEL